MYFKDKSVKLKEILMNIYESLKLSNPPSLSEHFKDVEKHEKKISEIKPIPDKPFTESERNVVIGTRLSDYESMLDFICNYLTFSISNIKADRIKQLVEFNNKFTNYNGKTIRGNELISIMNRIIDY